MILDKINPSLLQLGQKADQDLADIFNKIDEITLYNSNKVLSKL